MEKNTIVVVDPRRSDDGSPVTGHPHGDPTQVRHLTVNGYGAVIDITPWHRADEPCEHCPKPEPTPEVSR